MRHLKIGKMTIAGGNSKMGEVMHINLPPPMTCSHELPCYKEGCYAMKFYRIRKTVRAAWDGNWEALQEDRENYFRVIEDAVRLHKPKMFRWHSAGDIPDLNYGFRMEALAYRNPGTNFMAFTKRYDLIYELGYQNEGLQEPLHVKYVLSGWPGMLIPERLKRAHPVAYMRDPKNPDPGIPENALPCGGGCDKCGLCWLMKPGQSVVFRRH